MSQRRTPSFASPSYHQGCGQALAGAPWASGVNPGLSVNATQAFQSRQQEVHWAEATRVNGPTLLETDALPSGAVREAES